MNVVACGFAHPYKEQLWQPQRWGEAVGLDAQWWDSPEQLLPFLWLGPLLRLPKENLASKAQRFPQESVVAADEGAHSTAP
jgi:hypothetical protein